MSQDSLFDLGCAPAPRGPQAADATRRGPSCWVYCGHLGITEHRLLGSKVTQHPYRLCHHMMDEPVPIFEHNTICEHALERLPANAPAVSVMSQRNGWEDY